jgi:hypothetical protein
MNKEHGGANNLQLDGSLPYLSFFDVYMCIAHTCITSDKLHGAGKVNATSNYIDEVRH